MNHRINTAKTAAVATDFHWIPVDADTPRGVKVLLIHRAYGVAVIGFYTGVPNFWTHWAPLPRWGDA